MRAIEFGHIFFVIVANMCVAIWEPTTTMPNVQNSLEKKLCTYPVQNYKFADANSEFADANSLPAASQQVPRRWGYVSSRAMPSDPERFAKEAADGAEQSRKIC